MSTPHILFILTNADKIGPHERATGYYFPEVAHPWEIFDEAGIAIDFASLQGGAPPEDGYDPNDHAQLKFRQSKAFRRMNRSRKLSELDVTDYDAIFIPGGLGPMVDMATTPQIKEAIAQAWEAHLIVGAVCHGPVALLDVKLSDGSPLIQGRKLTGFSNAEEQGYAKDDVSFHLETALREQGAEFSEAAPWQAHVVVDGRLITGQNPASATPLAQAMKTALEAAHE